MMADRRFDPRLLPVDRRSALPMQQQLYDRIRQAIAEGRLRAGERVASTRSLATQLGVARGTVEAAYGRLAGEGYLTSRGQAGTIVSPEVRQSAVAARSGPNDPLPAAWGDRPGAMPVRFHAGLPALDLFPRALWARLAARTARRLHGAGLAYPAPSGLPELREAIAAYLAVSRGIACQAAQVFVTGGYQGGLTLAARLVLQPGDRVWFEDPGYALARRGLEAMGARIVPVPVDAQGLRVDDAARACAQARMVVVTPAHQSPLGVALSLPRRQALLAWASQHRGWILEDDYDSEFHYTGHKPAALKSLDTDDRVLFAGSFSKTLFPGLRLGYLVVPRGLAEAAATACRLLCCGQPAFEQALVASFLAEGHFARHLRTMRTRYAARRQAMVAALAGQFGDGLRLSLQAGGLHVVARLPDGADDLAMAGQAQRDGLAVTALSAQAVAHPTGPALLLGFTNLPESEAAAWVGALKRAVDTP